MQGRRTMGGLALIGAVTALHGLVYSWLAAPSSVSLSRLTPVPSQAMHASMRLERPVRLAAAAAGVPSHAMAVPPKRVRSRHVAAPVARAPTAAAIVSGDATGAAVDQAPAAPPPLYVTRVPPSARLDYQVERGIQALGQARLDWWQDGHTYRLSLLSPDTAVAGQAQRELTSVGRVGAHGLEPARFVDHRAHRGARAVSLLCDVGEVSFSASTARRDCVPGMQDNLSWWLQLSAIVAALPQMPSPGATFSAAVARTHGTVDRWVFEVVGQSESDVAAVLAVPTIKLVRRPDRTSRFDTTAEVWLDAAPPHWPLRVKLQEARGEPLVWTRLPSPAVN